MKRSRTGPDPDTLRRWLAAETAEDRREQTTDAAETALFQLFQSLPRPAPSDGFAAQVLERAGVASVPTPVFAALKWAVAVSVVVAGISCFGWLPAAVELLGPVSWSAPVELLSGAVRALGSGLRRGFVFWETISRLGGAFGTVASQPSVLATLAALVAISSVAFRALLGLTSKERSLTHA